MKNRTNQILLLLFLVSLAIYGVIFAPCFSVFSINLSPLRQMLVLCFHSVPMFFVQLLLCRLSKRWWWRLIPFLPIIEVGLIFLYFTGWDIPPVLWWCVAPTAGCLLAWAVSFLGKCSAQKEGDSMVDQTDIILLAAFLLFLLFYVFAVYCYSGGDSRWPDLLYYVFAIPGGFSLCLPAVPAFFLQLFLCRRKRRWLAALPGLAAVGAVLLFFHSWFTASTGWDTLYRVLLTILFIPFILSAAAGCALARVVYRLHQSNLHERGNILE